MATRITEDVARALFLLNNLEPLEPFPGTQKPWKSKCLITGELVSPTYGKVRDFGHRCIYCSRGIVSAEEAITVMKKSGFDPIVPFPGTNKAWKCKCVKCGKTTTPTYWNVAKGTGCKYCSSRAVDPKDAEIEMRARGFEPLELFPGATQGWLVRCKQCTREFKVKFHSLNTKKRCKYCAGVAVIEEDLIEKLSELKLEPLESYKTAKTPWKCKCLVCGHIVQPTWNRIKQGRGHCAYCAQRRVDIPEALKFMKSIDLKPLVEFPGNNKPWLCECLKCHANVTPRWSDVRRGQGGCSNCANYGLNYQKPGFLYLVTNEELNSHKIGIANSYKSRKFDDRMYQHQKRGWTIFKKMNFETVKQASDVEAAVLSWLRMEVGLPIKLTRKQMPQGGHTETVDSSEIHLEVIWNKVKELVDNAK